MDGQNQLESTPCMSTAMDWNSLIEDHSFFLLEIFFWFIYLLSLVFVVYHFTFCSNVYFSELYFEFSNVLCVKTD